MRQLFGPILAAIRATIWRPAFRPYIVYALFMAIVFAGMARFDHRFLINADPQWHLAALLLLAALLGVLFVAFALPKYFPGIKTSFKTGLVVGGNLWGLLFFGLVSPQIGQHFASPLYVSVLLPALFSFSLPWLFLCAVRAIAAIPALRFLPLEIEHLRDVMAELRWAENKDKGIRWVFEGNFMEVSNSGQYQFQTYTPHKVEENTLEYLFKALLSLHNHNLNPLRPLLFEAKEGLYGWEFHTRRSWPFHNRRRALDPYKTIKKNRLGFWRIREEERLKSKEKLSVRFRVSTIFITRTLPAAASQPDDLLVVAEAL